MKKIATRALVIAFIVFLIDWGIMGLKLLDNDYNITIEAYIGLVCWIIIFASIICRALTDKCPHCGRSAWRLFYHVFGNRSIASKRSVCYYFENTC